MKRARSAKATLIFGEDDNDREAIKELVLALRPDLEPVEKRKRPLVLVKGRKEAEARKAVADIAAVVRADSAKREIRMVLLHQDCDDIEPAHIALSEKIERHMEAEGLAGWAVTPAWEMEAWWFLWPKAATAVHSKWAEPRKSGRNVGLVRDAKEELRRCLRPKTSGKPPRDYEESDAPRIAAKVRELGLVREPDAKSASFERFRDRIDGV